MNDFSNSTEIFYRHSGKAPLLGLVMVGAAGFVSIPILGLLYGYLIFYIPFIYLSILLVIGYIFAVTFVLSKAVELGKIRNGLIVGLAGFFFGLLAEYAGWVAWIAAITKEPRNLIAFFFPFDVISFIIEIGRDGVWSFDNTTPSGGLLYFIWLVEAVMVVGGIAYYTAKLSLETPYCEESDRWANKKVVLGAFAPLADPQKFKSVISQGIFSEFNQLTPIRSGSAFTLLELYQCDECKNFFVLNVNDVQISRDYRGRQNRKSKTIVKNLRLTPSTLNGLVRMIQEQQARSSEAQPSQK